MRSSGPRARSKGRAASSAAEARGLFPPRARLGRPSRSTTSRAGGAGGATTWYGTPSASRRCAQALVTAHQLGAARHQGREVERALQPDHRGEVVGGVAGPPLIEEPEPLLGEGERQRLRAAWAASEARPRTRDDHGIGGASRRAASQIDLAGPRPADEIGPTGRISRRAARGDRGSQRGDRRLGVELLERDGDAEQVA